MIKNIPAKELRNLNPANYIETISVEVNFKNQKWIIIGIYHPPNQNEIYFLDELGKLLDFYSRSYERILILGDILKFFVFKKKISEFTCNLCKEYVSNIGYI